MAPAPGCLLMLVMVPASAGAEFYPLLLVLLGLRNVSICSLFHRQHLSKAMDFDCHQACPGLTSATPATATACRMVEQRQIAERQRQAGNAAFKQQQYSEALRCYQAGLEVQRHSMALHANAAAAALKLNCYVQALEHCDKVRKLLVAADGMLTGVQAQCLQAFPASFPHQLL
jgi:tetratricopeptide (TPR) repeat protein